MTKHKTQGGEPAGAAAPAEKPPAKGKGRGKGGNKAGKVAADEANVKVKLDADWEAHLLPDEAHDTSVSVPCVLFLYLVGQCVLGTCVCVSMITHF